MFQGSYSYSFGFCTVLPLDVQLNLVLSCNTKVNTMFLQEIFKQTHRQRKNYGYGLWQLVEEAWQATNSMLVHKDQVPIQAGNAPADSPCLVNGTCVCGPPGPEALHFHAQFVALMCKPHFLAPRAKPASRQASGESQTAQKKKKPPKTVHRVLMEQGFFVVRASCVSLPMTSSDSSWSRRLARLTAASEAPAITDGGLGHEQEQESLKASHWYHISYMNFRNWRFACTPLKFVRSDEDGIHLETFDPIGSCQHVDFLKQRMDFQQVWTTCYYTIRSTDQPLAPAEMAPGHVVVQAYEGIPKLRVWMGSEKETERRSAARAQQTSRSRTAPASRQSRQGPARGKGKGRGRLGPEPLVEAVEDAAVIPSGSENSEPAAASDADLSSDAEEALGEDVPDLDAAEDAPAPSWAPGPSSGSGLSRRYCDRIAVPRELAGTSAASSSSRAAASSTEAVSRATGAPKVRSGTEVVFDVEGGSLHYYPKNKLIQAFCKHHAGDCRKGRTILANDGERRAFQGRPLGFLLSWLQTASEYSDRASHCRLHVPPGYATRLQAREHFMTLPGASTFAAYERPRRDGEGPEPAEFA